MSRNFAAETVVHGARDPENDSVLGFFAPKGTPAAVVKRLETELLSIAQSAEMKEALTKQGLEANAASGADLAKLVKAEIDVYKAVFKAANIKME